MKKRYIIVLIVILSMVFTRCDLIGGYTYLSGTVKNSKQDYILLSKGLYQTIDTLKLDKHGRFSKKIKLKEGVYSLMYGFELQYVYLKPRAKTSVNFDVKDIDKVTYDGDNAQENRELTKNILDYHTNEAFFRPYYTKDYKTFRKVLDSVIEVKKSYLKNYKSEHKGVSETFLEYLEMATMYNIYSQLEYYSIDNIKRNTQKYAVSYKEIIKNRKNLDLTRDEYMYYFPYYRALLITAANDVFLQEHKSFSDKFTSNLIRTLDKRIQNQHVKDVVLVGVMRYFLLNKATEESMYTSLIEFKKACKDETFLKEMDRLYQYEDKYKVNTRLPNFEVYGHDNEVLYIRDLMMSRKSIIFFNTPYYSENITKKQINKFIDRYPDINFIIINKDIKLNGGFATSRLVYAKQDSQAKDCTELSIPILLLLDEDGIIQNTLLTPFSDDVMLKIHELYSK